MVVVSSHQRLQRLPSSVITSFLRLHEQRLAIVGTCRSTLTSAMSFTITATRRPCAAAKRALSCFDVLVFIDGEET